MGRNLSSMPVEDDKYRTREFGVEGVTDPRQALSQLEVRGQKVEPVWSTPLSPDSACSEGSAGSLEQQHDADTDSLSQGSSVGSLVLEDEEDRNSLKNHFDTLASSLTEEKFETDLRTLQPEEKHYLNPRLSISSRFLSRFQDRVRAWPSRGAPPASIPTRISEESNVSNTSVNPESSSEVSSAESTQKDNKIGGDVASRTLELVPNSCVASTVQQGVPRLRYLGTTASSRAKLCQDLPTSNPDEEEDHLSSSSDLQHSVPLLYAAPDLHNTKPDSTQDETTSITASQHHRSSVSSVETVTNQNQTLSPSLSITPTAVPPACTIITSDIIGCCASKQEEGQDESKTRIQTDPASEQSLDPKLFSDLPTLSFSPLSERPQPGDDDESVNLQQCQQVANELRQTARRAIHLYQRLHVSVNGSERRLQMSSVLQGAFDVVQSELRAVLQEGDEQCNSASSGGLKDEETMSLLEKYSELLVQMTQNKLNRI